MSLCSIPWQKTPPVVCRAGAVAIGNFDGVHRGHVALIAELCCQARAVNGPAVVLTFDSHPLQLLRPAQFMPVLTTLADRVDCLHAGGADHVVVLRTTHELLQLRATEFFDRIIRERLAARALVEGFNFGFGRDREGNVDTLKALCVQHGLVLSVVSPLLADVIPISSSRVRAALLKGDMQDAAALLGRPYRLRGMVGTGQRRGQGLGFPTANLEKV
jgi:riboflavin kinase/FMN adenylyltransferase